MPDRPHSMDDIPCGKPVAFGDFGLSCTAAAQRAAFRQQLRPGRTVNGSVHTSAAQQALVCGIDNGIHFHGGDVVSYNLKRHTNTSPVWYLHHTTKGNF